MDMTGKCECCDCPGDANDVLNIISAKAEKAIYRFLAHPNDAKLSLHQQTNTCPFGTYHRLPLLAFNFSFSERLILAFRVLSPLLLLIVFIAPKTVNSIKIQFHEHGNL
jgi:hypothetical protein